MRILSALLCVGLAGCTSFGTVKNCTLHIQVENGSCSATVIGPHAILTAAHCLSWPYTLRIGYQPARVKRAMLDGNDHIILIVDRTFPRWVLLGTADQGDQVSIIGNPGNLSEQYRHGYVAGHLNERGKLATTYDLRIYLGDSGAGIFNAYGNLTGVVSFIYAQDSDAGMLTMAGSYPLAFTAEQWREARNP
jgi:hypothetical protein